MKVNLKFKKNKNKEGEVEAEVTPTFEMTKMQSQAVVSFNAAMDQLETVLVERSTEIKALKLCIASKEHLMLDGAAGVAKSMFAREVFNRIKGASCFRKQLTSNTLPDEVLGCMISKKYKEDAVWEYNTDGMFPACDFAFLDEVYRAAKSFLSNMMQVLNERTFFNGTKEIICPLVTAIGTTNFVIDDDELIAFHDRWLVKVKVKPLSGRDAKVAALNKFWNSFSNRPNFEELKTVSFQDIGRIHTAMSNVVVSETIMELYEELVRSFVSNAEHVVVSDRRFCQMLKLAVAEYVLDEDRPDAFSESYLMVTCFGLCEGDDDKLRIFGDVFEKVVGERVVDRRMSKRLLLLKKVVKQMVSDFDPSMEAKMAKRNWIKVQTYINALDTFPTNEIPRGESKKLIEEIRGDLSGLNLSLREALVTVISKEAADEIDEL